MTVEKEFLTQLGAARLLQEMLTCSGAICRSPAAAWCPPTDVFQTADTVVVKMEIPGCRPEHLRIQANPLAVLIQGYREDRDRRRKVRVAQMELCYGEFVRVIELPCPVNARKAKSAYDGAMLEVTLPKSAKRGKLDVIVSIKL